MDHQTDAGLTAIAEACRSLGFNALMAAPPPDRVGFMAEQCHRRGIRLYLSTAFAGGESGWQQVMTPAEQQRAQGPVAPLHRHGGEPLIPGEVFEQSLPCWNRPEVRAHFRAMVQNLAKLPADGLALDFVGYANYYRCYCPICAAKLREYRSAHPDIAEREAAAALAEDTLVGFINEMAAVAREARPGIGLTIHVYPYFRPNPFYGNRLAVDTAGQTVSWFFRPHWPLAKVRAITSQLVATQRAFCPSSAAAPFIGFYCTPPRDFRSARRIAAELAIIRDCGADALQVAELGNIMQKPTVAEAVARALGGSFRTQPTEY